jgi:hypothetical protein
MMFKLDSSSVLGLRAHRLVAPRDVRARRSQRTQPYASTSSLPAALLGAQFEHPAWNFSV